MNKKGSFVLKCICSLTIGLVTGAVLYNIVAYFRLLRAEKELNESAKKFNSEMERNKIVVQIQSGL